MKNLTFIPWNQIAGLSCIGTYPVRLEYSFFLYHSIIASLFFGFKERNTFLL